MEHIARLDPIWRPLRSVIRGLIQRNAGTSALNRVSNLKIILEKRDFVCMFVHRVFQIR